MRASSAVSYTHLDVYKRQPYDFNGRNLTPYGGLLPVMTMLEKLGDVYKRQVYSEPTEGAMGDWELPEPLETPMVGPSETVGYRPARAIPTA